MSRAMSMLSLAAAAVGTAFVAATLRSNPPGPVPGPHPDRGEMVRPSQPGRQPRTNPETRVYALAHLEPAGGLIVVGARPGLRIERVLVSVGDVVQAGQAMAILEGREEAVRRLALAEAQKVAALQQRARKRDQIALERAREDRLQPIRLAMLSDTTKALEVEDRHLSKNLDALGDDPKFAREHEEILLKLDQVRIESYRAVFELEQARADEVLLARKRGIEDQALADGGPDDRVLDSQIDLARTGLDATTVTAPVAGRVIDVQAHGGEISAGPLVTLGDLGAMDAVAEVDQADAHKVKEGDVAEVTITGMTVPGKVTRVGRLVGRNRLQDVDPRAMQDLRILKVTIRLDAAQPADRFVNMQVEVAIKPGEAPAR